jgi:hypothetical protein
MASSRCGNGRAYEWLKLMATCSLTDRSLSGPSRDPLRVYLDEFLFRHNRRRLPRAAFQTLLGLGTGRSAGDPFLRRGQWHPQERGVQPQLPAEDVEALADDL